MEVLESKKIILLVNSGIGPQGIQGIQGIQGDTGPQGDIGLTGPQGPSVAVRKLYICTLASDNFNLTISNLYNPTNQEVVWSIDINTGSVVASVTDINNVIMATYHQYIQLFDPGFGKWADFRGNDIVFNVNSQGQYQLKMIIEFI